LGGNLLDLKSLVGYLPETQDLRLKNPNSSVGGDSKVDRDPGLSLNQFAALDVWFEMPLANGVLSRGRQDAGAAQHPQILNHSILANQRLKNY
jgi:hypothetical protein